MAKRKILVSVRLDPADAEFINGSIPPRRRSQFIQRAVRNGVKGLRIIREIGTIRQMRTDGSTYISVPRWARVLDQYLENP